MNFEDKATIAAMVEAIAAKGWASANCSARVTFDKDGWVVENVSYKSSSGYDPEISIYCSGVGVADDVLDRFPTPDGHALKAALEALALAQRLAGELGLSDELLAPLAAAADGLRNNLLPAPIWHDLT